MIQDVYKDLAHFLDKLPGGYPATESGVELRILRRLFTEEEAAFTLHLSMRPEQVEAIAERAGLDPGLCAERLETMSKKGLIFRQRRSDGPRYSASQFVIGIWEYHVNDLDPGLIADFNEYLPYLFDFEVWRKVPQLRTIPVVESVQLGREILPYEHAEQLVRERDNIAVAPCICRREHRMVGKGCDRPEETCLILGSAADYYVENGLGRYIDVEEAFGILELAEQSGLVLQPSNSQRIVNICCCCGCCCQVLKSFKRHPAPASLVTSPYVVASDPALCVGCGDCVERCQMGAVSLVDEISVIDLERCIGCGLCVTTCTSESLHLVRKPSEQQPEVPRTLARTYVKLARERGVLRSRDTASMALREAKDKINFPK
ncbi:MAG: 4Fe-4S ferredoxin [Anaerolineales bacterium]|nr:4Fe-4S ferredoxin [Anaerolineales bacterium]